MCRGELLCIVERSQYRQQASGHGSCRRQQCLPNGWSVTGCGLRALQPSTHPPALLMTSAALAMSLSWPPPGCVLWPSTRILAGPTITLCKVEIQGGAARWVYERSRGVNMRWHSRQQHGSLFRATDHQQQQ